MEHTNQKQNINITEALMVRINELISHYPSDKRKSALLPVLHEVQDAHDNWLSVELMDKVYCRYLFYQSRNSYNYPYYKIEIIIHQIKT